MAQLVVQSVSTQARWVRRYVPLLALVAALFMTVMVLPNALKLPQSNPSTVLEYAPVPPEDDDNPPQIGSLSSLGLGSTSGLKQGANNSPKPTAPREGGGETPVTKRCVGKPLRQTEDPNSPPCVPFFEGDNGGETWQGVTGNEIRVLIYHSAFISDQNETEGGDSSAGETTPSNTYCDLDLPDDKQPTGWQCADDNTGDPLSLVEAARALSRYFNDRFQTYNRHIHFYIYFTNSSGAAGRRADAAANWETLKPFAVIDRATFGGYNSAYAGSIAGRRVSSFGSFGFLEAKFYQDLAPMVWNFWPDIEHWADMYVTYICKKVVPFPAAHAGDDKQDVKMNGKPRKFALMHTTDASYPGLHKFADLVEAGVKQCGVKDLVDVTFPLAGANIDNRRKEDELYAQKNIAKMQEQGVTTVLWAGGMESRTTAAANTARFYPEWVVAGDRILDDLLNARAQNQEVWRHAWVVSNHLKEIRFEDSPSRQAFREASPGGRQVHEYWATTLYKDIFATAKAIQVAGPELTPQAIDQGHHAIPRYSSNDPKVAACFYDPGDYSCVKDAHEAWWDPDATDPNSEPGVIGCWRMVRGGKRYLARTWEGGDDVFGDPAAAQCNGIKGTSSNYLN